MSIQATSDLGRTQSSDTQHPALLLLVQLYVFALEIPLSGLKVHPAQLFVKLRI